jgi:hypothetical protein
VAIWKNHTILRRSPIDSQRVKRWQPIPGEPAGKRDREILPVFVKEYQENMTEV